jgi:hypothetical protein
MGGLLLKFYKDKTQDDTLSWVLLLIGKFTVSRL